MKTSHDERGAIHIVGFIAFVVIIGLGLGCLVQFAQIASLKQEVLQLEHRVDIMDTKISLMTGLRH